MIHTAPLRGKHSSQLVSKETEAQTAQTNASSFETIDSFSLKDFPRSPFSKSLSFLSLPFLLFFDLHIFIFLVFS